MKLCVASSSSNACILIKRPMKNALLLVKEYKDLKNFYQVSLWYLQMMLGKLKYHLVWYLQMMVAYGHILSHKGFYPKMSYTWCICNAVNLCISFLQIQIHRVLNSSIEFFTVNDIVFLCFVLILHVYKFYSCAQTQVIYVYFSCSVFIWQVQRDTQSMIVNWHCFLVRVNLAWFDWACWCMISGQIWQSYWMVKIKMFYALDFRNIIVYNASWMEILWDKMIIVVNIPKYLYF